MFGNKYSVVIELVVLYVAVVAWLTPVFITLSTVDQASAHMQPNQHSADVIVPDVQPVAVKRKKRHLLV